MSKELKEVFISLIENDLDKKITDIIPLPKSGSSRIYYRIMTEDGSFIATYNSNVEENNAFFSFTNHFRDLKLPVPQILAVNDNKTCYIQTDFGDFSLFDFVNTCAKNKKFDDKTITLYCQAIDKLIDFQIKGHEVIDYSVAFPTPFFDKKSILDDLNYFKYYFLKVHDEIVFNETRLNADFQNFADYIYEVPSDFFMYRDFQSRNIMIKDDKTYFIDYQGGRKGPLQYDLVSLLYQVKAQLPNDIRLQLLRRYKEKISRFLDLNIIQFDKYYKAFILLRLLQVLGAYGFRGLIQKKQHFLESIPYALNELMILKNDLDFLDDFKELSSVLSQMEMIKNKYDIVKNEKLTVIINSFSYKNGGIPVDFSGNGGGHVFDCRALPNPGRYEEYKKLTGQDKEVQDFLNDKEEVSTFRMLTQNIVNQSVDNYIKRDFKNLFINFGCTGGQHRSVFFAQKCAECLHEKYPNIRVVLNHVAQNKSYLYE